MPSMKTGFLNVDLEIQSRSSLDELAEAFAGGAAVLGKYRRGRVFYAAFELASQPKNADEAIRGLVKLVESLPRPVRHIWNLATRRDFNVGMQGGSGDLVIDISATTIQLVARERGRIVLTMYPPPPNKRRRPSRAL